MSAKDQIHEIVKQALIEDGWTITADPYELSYKELSLAVDLAAERLIEATRNEEKILVEVKSFLGRSFAKEFQGALGQYQVYLGLLEALNVTDTLYLAVSDVVYRRFFQQTAYQLLVERFQMRLLIVDIANGKVVSWIA
jgi:hypothetical protein